MEVEGLNCRGVSIGEDVSEVDELNEVARLCMLRDVDSLAFSSESLVTCRVKGKFTYYTV